MITKPRGTEVLEWLLAVAQRLEYEGICANGELLLADILQRREVSRDWLLFCPSRSVADSTDGRNQGYTLQ